MADRLDARALGIAIAAATFAVDQAVKAVVTGLLAAPPRYLEILPIFRLYWVENTGVSMGFLNAGGHLGRWALVALTIAITVGVAIWVWREHRRWDGAALGLVLGGALGNILDRARFGYVVDFADLHFGEWRPFLVFNVADAAISIGVAVLVLRALFVREDGRRVENEHA